MPSLVGYIEELDKRRSASRYRIEEFILFAYCALLLTLGAIKVFDASVPDQCYTTYVHGRTIQCNAKTVGDRGGSRGVYYRAAQENKFVKAFTSADKYREIEIRGVDSGEAGLWLDACADAVPKDIFK